MRGKDGEGVGMRGEGEGLRLKTNILTCMAELLMLPPLREDL